MKRTLLDRRFHVDHILSHAASNKVWERVSPNVQLDWKSQVKNKIIVGTSEPYGQGDVISIPRYEIEGGSPSRLSIFIHGSAGFGKSKLLKMILAQGLMLGESAAVISDPKNEFACIDKKPPLPTERWKLPKNYFPTAVPTRAYIPEYITDGRDTKPRDISSDSVFNYRLSDLQLDDLKTLLGIRDDSVDQTNANMELLLNAAYTALKEKLGSAFSERKLEDLETVIRSMPTHYEGEGFIARVTKQKLVGKLQALRAQKVFGQLGISQVQDIIDGRVPVLVNKYSQNPNFDRTYAGIFARQIYNARMEGALRKPIWFVLEESQVIMSRASSSLSVIAENVLRMGRQKLMHVLAATQQFSASGDWRDSIPPEILGQFNYIITFRLMDAQGLETICRARGYDFHDYRRKLLQELAADPRRRVFEAALIHPNGEITTFYPYDGIMLNHAFEGQ